MKHGPNTCAWLQIATKQATWAALESPWLNKYSCVANSVSVSQTRGQILGSTTACVAKQGPDACAWLQVAALETQLGSTNTSASQNSKPLA